MDQGSKNPRTLLPLWAVVAAPVGTLVLVDAISPSGPFPAAMGLVVGLILFGLGYLVLRAFLPKDLHGDLLLLAPAAGLIVAGGGAFLAAQHGLPLKGVLGGCLLLGLPGLWLAAKPIARCWSRPITYGVTITATVIAIILIYFLPVSLRDAVVTSGGEFQWIYVDDSYHQSIVSMIATGAHPVPSPGLSAQPLAYHFGPQALAATLVQVVGMNAGDAYVRVLRMIGIASLVCAVSAFGFGIAPHPKRANLSLILALCFTFFVCSAYEVFAMHYDSGGHMPAHVPHLSLQLGSLFSLDMYKETVMMGSGLWGITTLFVSAALLIRGRDGGIRSDSFCGAECLLAPLGIGLNTLAGISACGVIAGAYLLLGWKRWQTYLWIAGMTALCFLVTRGPTQGLATSIGGIASPGQIPQKMVDILVWMTFTLLALKGLAYLTFLYGNKKIVVSLALFTLGWIPFYMVIQVYMSNQVYAMVFLSSLVGAYAAGPATYLWMRIRGDSAISNHSTDTIVNLFKKVFWPAVAWGVVTLLMVGLFQRTAFRVGVTLGLVILLLVGFFLLGAWQAGPASAGRRLALGVFGALFVASALGSVAIAAKLGWNGLGTTISLDAGRVRSLAKLRQATANNALIATAHHTVPQLLVDSTRCYEYGALSGRRVLLEGWLFRENSFPTFLRIRSDNDTLFATTSAEQAAMIVRKYGVTHIVTEPSEPLHFETSGWLRRLDNVGTLGLWEVINSGR
jgi:hypothetical protein